MIIFLFIFLVNRITSQRQISFSLKEDNQETNHTCRCLHEIPTKANHVIDHLPGVNDPLDNIVQYAGLLPIQNEEHLFYWLFTQPTTSTTAVRPLAIWLNGGPGCSSMDGLFHGVGPYHIVKTSPFEITTNHESILKFADLLFIDQPIGTGLSSVHDPSHIRSSTEEIKVDFYYFLIEFFKVYDEFTTVTSSIRTTKPIYLFGESFAGRYIGLFADYIYMQNAMKNKSLHIQLEGIGIGNGWIHPIVQYDYSDYSHGLGFISYEQKQVLKEKYKKCLADFETSNLNSQNCLGNMQEILQQARVSNGKYLNFYDVREFINNIDRDYPEDLKDMEAYLSDQTTQTALHVSLPSNFSTCDPAVYKALENEDGKSVLSHLERVLDAGLRVMIYAGQWDMMCNHYSMEGSIRNLTWKSKKDYFSSERYTYHIDNYPLPAGYIKSGGGLTYILVPEAGHMVSFNVPKVFTDMIKKFVLHQSYDMDLQELDSSDESLILGTDGSYLSYMESTRYLLLLIISCIACSAASSMATFFLMRDKDKIQHQRLPSKDEDEIEDGGR